jgi:hypothetical protein
LKRGAGVWGRGKKTALEEEKKGTGRKQIGKKIKNKT